MLAYFPPYNVASVEGKFFFACCRDMNSKNYFSLSEVDFSLGAGETVVVSAH